MSRLLLVASLTWVAAAAAARADEVSWRPRITITRQLQAQLGSRSGVRSTLDVTLEDRRERNAQPVNGQSQERERTLAEQRRQNAFEAHQGVASTIAEMRLRNAAEAAIARQDLDQQRALLRDLQRTNEQLRARQTTPKLTESQQRERDPRATLDQSALALVQQKLDAWQARERQAAQAARGNPESLTITQRRLLNRR